MDVGIQHTDNNHTTNDIEISVVDKIRRFCYIGIVDQPVYMQKELKLISSDDFQTLKKLCMSLTQQQHAECVCNLVADSKMPSLLPRRDEVLLVVAIMLCAITNDSQRLLSRQLFPTLVQNATDLAKFVECVNLVMKIERRNVDFNRTVLKAIIEWYRARSVDDMVNMWMSNEGQVPLHRHLLHRCSYTKQDLSPDLRAACRLMFLSPGKVIQWSDELKPLDSYKQKILGVANVRLVVEPKQAAEIIQQNSLSYEKVPYKFLTEASVIDLVVPKMSYVQLLETWPKLYKICKANSESSNKYTHRFFEDAKLRAANVEPLRLLLQQSRCLSKRKATTAGTHTVNPPTFIAKLYERSFGMNESLGKRMNITLNLEALYLKKYLKGRWHSVKYLDAVVALAFGYYRTELEVTVQFWKDKEGALARLPWHNMMSITEAIATCKEQNVQQIKQSLEFVIMTALTATETYDVFLIMVPWGSRSNPNHASELLYMRLEEYRKKRNASAKLILISMRQAHASMWYSTQRNEHILELCGISDKSPNIIKAFASDKFV